MKNQQDLIDETDLGTFLGDIAKSLIKEGLAIEALADKRLGDDETQVPFKRMGIEISIWGEKLLILRDRLCQKCILQPVSIFISFEGSSKKGEKKDDK